MNWPGTRTRRERDHALVRAVQLEARLRDVSEERERVQARLREAEAALERVVDNALFAAGAAPVFHPEDKRFQPRDVATQQAEAARAQPPLTAGEWRRKVEAADAERAARDRKARLAEELEREVQQRRQREAHEGAKT